MLISELKGIGEKKALALNAAGIFSVEDLLNHFPRDYDDRSNVKTVSQLMPEAVNTIRGVVSRPPECSKLKRITLTKAVISDHTGTLEIIWFNQPFLKKNFKLGTEYIFTGKVREIHGRKSTGITLQMQSPDYEPTGGHELTGGRIVPIYTPPKGFSQKTFRKLVHQALTTQPGFENERVKGQSPLVGEWGQSPHGLDPIPPEIREKYSLCPREAAIRNIHFPTDDEAFFAARRRLVFEELLFMQLALAGVKKAAELRRGLAFDDLGESGFLEVLPFTLTKAQTNVLSEIIADVSQGKCLNRLVQGDVGSGKTAIAFAAAYLAAKNGFQAAIMAPTDVLANQHFLQAQALFAPLGFRAEILTGSITAKQRRETLAKIADGSAAIIIGTHALIQKSVTYHNLGLCITDEQHRFGVNQRLSLTMKGAAEGEECSERLRAPRSIANASSPARAPSPVPHTLVMSATPIPRTLGLILYGDLDISVMDELPPGRQEIKTFCVDSGYRGRVTEFIRKEVALGNQAYIICPTIQIQNNPEAEVQTELQNVTNYTQSLSAALPEIKIARLHGKMKPDEKQHVMDAFKSGEVKVIVSTTVIEVGVHVENATLMVVENAERFGLSQLHQLRGRVGRGAAQSYCVLITDTKNEQTRARMKAMCQTTDGFKLAEMDLEQRGAGDFFGTRQHGLPALKIANLYRDLDILKEAQNAAKEHADLFSQVQLGIYALQQ
jgi:ATP-dependent DNA helicase RecG